MLCPVCKTVNLAMTDRQGIEVDYCPDCRGIWLDRGELDRLIARAEQDTPAPPRASPPPPPPQQGHAYPPAYGHRESRHHDSGKHDDRYRQHDGYRHGKKRKSLLGELFDF
jgi:Zn-finger nucleic acid-binding protein